MRRLLMATLLAGDLVFLCACGSSQPVASAPTINVLSSRTDLIAGGNALVEIVPPLGVDPSNIRVQLGGTDITSSFAMRPNGKFEGLVTGLTDGANILSASSGSSGASSISLINHPASGPVLYGPQITPWACGAGATDAQCDHAVSYSYKYISTNTGKSGFQDYNAASPPTDVATTTTDTGVTAPFVVRLETGVINRDYYNVAVLFDPSKSWAPWEPQAGWDQKLLVKHGAGCGMGYGQVDTVAMSTVLDQYALSKGHAVLSVALNDAGHNCNLPVEAEAMIMTKQHFVEIYGPPTYTFGYGASGGGLAQQWMANAFPGIYDGTITQVAFPDAGSTAVEVEDCALLRNYFLGQGVAWTGQAQAAVAGHIYDAGTGDAVCQNWIDFYGFNKAFNPSEGLGPTDILLAGLAQLQGATVAPTSFGGCDAPMAQIYNPLLNPGGTRCTLQDYMVTIFGLRSSDGFANRPYSNVGVQYGLAALNSGAITPDQFIDLNSKIGSHDINYNFQSTRVEADAGALASTYLAGYVNEAKGMATVANIHLRPTDTTTIHHQYRAWSIRARLDHANGTHGNQAIWYNAGSQNEAYDVMDQWLTALTSDRSTASHAQKVINNRPATANDRCSNQDGAGLTMQQCTGVDDGSPRMVAGESLTDDIVECQLKPLDRSSYSVTFTDSQWSTLQSVFPNGVCDYSLPGKGQQAAEAWMTYLDAIGQPVVGGTPLPAPPTGSGVSW